MPRDIVMKRILFVCTGNICRSPTAEGLFRHRIREAGLLESLEGDSAGTEGYHVGDPPDPRAIAEAARHGVAIEDLRARRLESADFERFDLLLGMDRGHLAIMRRLAPAGSRDRVGLLLEHAPDCGYREVPDPYYGGEAQYRLSYRLIDAGIDGLMRYLAGTVARASS
ncbi:MAG TPA: low molecular weight protein-tyrosine-phosphatase [Hypericibacter adhaerens]|uniref:protein-tyrosine-phosphatase n=1 Tax=Hypericibacter adhaerens TaxID=2602016 RepID=A0A5J6N7F0_9PROT|nr:low molecular weight protein-tyrosine-phosphatase [Hypericibacter adhaerens]QEX24985.1 phosphotyrosine protein phosphatase [Hypericibacter adhaerens]HWA43762.1 low molecular weight protein-tyrosine-phosphatase [Hypericibacter adhaerens]